MASSFKETSDDNLKVYDKLWPSVDWTEVLGPNSGVNVQSGTAITKYLRSHPDLVPELVVNDRGETIELFLSLDIPLKKLFINNFRSGLEFYDKWKPQWKQLLKKHGASITHLKIDQFSLWPAGNEEEFWKRLPNVEVFIGNSLLYMALGKFLEENKELDPECPIPRPEFYKNVRILDIGMAKTWQLWYEEITPMYTQVFKYLLDYIFPSVEELMLPYIVDTHGQQSFWLFDDGILKPITEKVILVGLHSIAAAIDYRDDNPNKGPKKLKKISFKNVYCRDPLSTDAREAEGAASKAFYELVRCCSHEGIVLEKVNASWFLAGRRKDYETWAGCVYSMVNIHPCVAERVILWYLQDLEVFTSRSCVIKPNGSILKQAPWPLKSLSLIVDSLALDGRAGEMYPEGREISSEGTYKPLLYVYKDHPIDYLFRFLFTTGFPQLTRLKLAVKHNLAWQPTLVSIQMIVSTCPNIKKLELCNWTGMNEWLLIIWKGLPQLEDIKLEQCNNLTNDAFIGGNVDDPVFARLSNLKTVSLIGLDKMPKVTDKFFELVLSRMGITHLFLSSEKPLQTVTESGIRKLLNGPISQTLVKFPFEGWSLSDCTDNRWKRLRDKFKTARMERENLGESSLKKLSISNL